MGNFNFFLDSLLICFRALDKSRNWSWVGFLVTLRIKYLITFTPLLKETLSQPIRSQLLHQDLRLLPYSLITPSHIAHPMDSRCALFAYLGNPTVLPPRPGPGLSPWAFTPSKTEKFCKPEMVHISVNCNN